MISMEETRRPQRNLEETTDRREFALLKLQSELASGALGSVMVAVFVENPTYPQTAGSAATIDYVESTRTVKVWLPLTIGEAADLIDAIVIATIFAERFYAVALIQEA